MGLMKRYGHFVRYTSFALGGLLIVLGILLVSGYWGFLNSLLA